MSGCGFPCNKTGYQLSYLSGNVTTTEIHPRERNRKRSSFQRADTGLVTRQYRNIQMGQRLLHLSRQQVFKGVLKEDKDGKKGRPP